MIAVLRQRNFALLWFGGLFSLTGNWVLFIALPLHVYQQTGSTLATGAMLMARLLPTLLLGSVAGVFIDRWDRKRTMVIADLARALILLPLLAVHSREWLWVVYVVAFAESTISQFFTPAENALLPRLVGEEHLVSANSLNSLNNNLARLVGPPLGGMLYALVGLWGVALADAVSYLVSGAMIALISVSSRPARESLATAADQATSQLASVWHEWKAGLGVVRRQRVVSVLFIMGALAAVGEGILGTLYVPFVMEVLEGDELYLGWLMTAQGVGGLIGGAIIAQWGKGLPTKQFLGVSAIMFGLIDAVMFNARMLETSSLSRLTIALLAICVVGVPAAGFGAAFSSLMQRSVADEYRGRVFGVLGTTEGLLVMVGLGLAGALAEVVGIVPMLNLDSALYVLAGITVLLFLPTGGPATEPGQDPAEAPAGTAPSIPESSHYGRE